MRPAGRAEVERAKADGRWDAAYDSPATAVVPDDLVPVAGLLASESQQGDRCAFQAGAARDNRQELLQSADDHAYGDAARHLVHDALKLEPVDLRGHQLD